MTYTFYHNAHRPSDSQHEWRVGGGLRQVRDSPTEPWRSSQYSDSNFADEVRVGKIVRMVDPRTAVAEGL